MTSGPAARSGRKGSSDLNVEGRRGHPDMTNPPSSAPRYTTFYTIRDICDMLVRIFLGEKDEAAVREAANNLYTVSRLNSRDSDRRWPTARRLRNTFQ